MQIGALIVQAACARETPSSATGAPPGPVAPPAASASVSRFSVPLQYDFSAMLKVVERAVPTTFGSMDSVRMIGTDDRRHYAFEAVRGPFTAFADGDHVHLRATVAYRAQGFFKPPFAPTISAGCGGDSVAERPRLVVELAAPLTLTQSWHLASRSRLVRVAPASTRERDHCDMTILHRDMTPSIVAAARSALLENLPEIDRKVGEVDLRDQFTEWWSLLLKPIQLTDGVWLVLGPERVRMGTVRGHEKTLTVPVSLEARPRIVTGREAPAPDTTPLPPLGHGATGEGFHITMDGFIDYGTASRALEAVLTGRTVVEAGHALSVQRVTVTPTPKGKLALAVTFSGDARGTLRFVGMPSYDEKRGMLAVPDLDYDLDVDSQLISTYSWLQSDKLRASFRERARFPAAPALARGRELLLAGLNRKLGDAVTLSAKVDSVAVRGLYVTRDGIVVRAEAAGRASMSVRQH